MKLRKVIQTLVFLLVLSISIGHSLEETGAEIPLLSTASLHAVCPLGGVVSIYEVLVSGYYVKKIHESSFILMIIVFTLAVIFGPVFCGWICPFGTFQEWVSKLGQKIFKRKFNTFIPYKVDKYLRFTRYIVMVMVLVKTAQSAQLVFANIDPYYALFNIWTDEVAIGGYVVLALTIIASLFVERPFCKYLCPYGAVLGITNLFKFFKIKRVEETCISCNMCDKKCPMNIPLSNIGISRDHQCISCLECTSEVACPKPNTMVIAFKDKVLKSKPLGLITVILFIVGIGGSMIFNVWRTEASKEPKKISEGEFAGESDPADIRGSYSLGDINEAFGIPIDLMVKAFMLEDVVNPANMQIKALEGIYHFELEEEIEIGTDSFRFLAALYKGIPFTPEETTRLLTPAYDAIAPMLSEEEKARLKGYLVDPADAVSVDIDTEAAQVEDEDHENAVLEIKGKTTFQETIDLGLSEDKIMEVLGEMPSDLNMVIRDYAEENGLEFSEIKEALLAE